MVQGVHRTQQDLHIPLRVQGTERLPHHLAVVVYVHVVVYHHDDLGEHGLPQRPNGIHDFSRVPGIGLPNRHNHQIMKNPLRRHRHVHNFRVLHLHHRQKDPLHRVAHVKILLRRRPHYRRQVNRLLAVCRALHVKDRVLPFERIKPGVIAKGALRPQFVQIHIPLKHNLRIRRHFQLIRLARHHLYRLAPQESREHHFVQIRRNGQHPRQRRRRVRANRHAHRNPSLRILLPRAPEMLRSVLLRLPVHSRGALVINLHPVHPDVALPGLRILRKHQRKCDESPTVLRPALQNRKVEQVHILAFAHDFLAVARSYAPWKERCELGQLRQHLDLVEEPLGRLHLQESLNPLGDLVESIHLERQAHSSNTPKSIDKQRNP